MTRPRTRRLASAVAFSLVVTTSCVATLIVASGAVSTSGATGYDISFPQCGHALPADPDFAVVGVNDGKPTTANACLATELRWAEASSDAAPSFYANTSDPGPANASDWPTGQASPEVCHGANSTPCAYDYGWNAAKVALANAVAAEAADGSADAQAQAVGATWWLDVETGNAWESIASDYGPTATSYANDQSSLEGMIAYFQSAGVLSVGVYSTSEQWRVINGPSTSGFPVVPVWIPGAGTLAAAEANCTQTSFTGGRVAMTQYPSGGYDGDYWCGLLSPPVTTTSPVATSSTFTDQLVTTNNDGAVTYTQLTGSPELVVSPSGLVTTSGPLAAGTYGASGTTSDASGDTGTFTFTLSVGLLVQSAPLSGTVKASGSAAYSVQLAETGADGAVTYAQLTGSPELVVSPSGLVTTSGPLAAGTYSASGTTSDAGEDAGTFTFTLSVGRLVQRAPTTASVTSDESSTFTDQLDEGANLGPVSYVQTTGLPSLVVSSSGLVTTEGALAAGTYQATGTTSDTTGDVGTFTFTLSVTASPTTTTTTSLPGSSTSTTTTTTTQPPGPLAKAVVGKAVAGKTVSLTIIGSGFFGRPRVTSHAGTKVTVTHDSGTSLVARVSVVRADRPGTFTFTLTFANHQTTRVRYVQMA